MIKTVIKILKISIKFFPDIKFKMNNSSDEEDNVPSPPPWRVKSEQIQVKVKEKLRQIKGQVRCKYIDLDCNNNDGFCFRSFT